MICFWNPEKPENFKNLLLSSFLVGIQFWSTTGGFFVSFIVCLLVSIFLCWLVCSFFFFLFFWLFYWFIFQKLSPFLVSPPKLHSKPASPLTQKRWFPIQPPTPPSSFSTTFPGETSLHGTKPPLAFMQDKAMLCCLFIWNYEFTRTLWLVVALLEL